MAEVSIIVPCYNAVRWIAETLRTALQPTVHTTEVIVIDDGSTDGSGDLVREAFPPVRLVATPNRGVSHARNLGIELARGQYLVFLDADDLLAPGKIDRQVALLEHSGADVAYGNWRRLRPGRDGAFRPAEAVERAMTRAPELELFTTFWSPPGAYLFRRSLVDQVGGFSPRLPIIQDARFALDCALHGGRFVHDPHRSCLYRTHLDGSVSSRNGKGFWHDCLTNALEVRDWWEQHGGLTPERLTAVLEVLDHVARSTAGVDPEGFAAACAEVEKYIGNQPTPARPVVQVLIRMLGYTRVRRIAGRLRRLSALDTNPLTVLG